MFDSYLDRVRWVAFRQTLALGAAVFLGGLAVGVVVTLAGIGLLSVAR